MVGSMDQRPPIPHTKRHHKVFNCSLISLWILCLIVCLCSCSVCVCCHRHFLISVVVLHLFGQFVSPQLFFSLWTLSFLHLCLIYCWG